MALVNKEEVEKLMKAEGEVRGVSLKNTSDFIIKEEGEEGLKKLEKAMTEIGQPLEYEEIKAMQFYPLGLFALYLLVIKRLFNYPDEKIQEIGKSNAKLSLVIKLFMKYFFSPQRVLKEVPKMWRKYYSVGKLSVQEFNEEEKRAILRIEDFSLHPVWCQDLAGFFSSMVQMVVGSEAKCQETKCTHRGDPYHEFLVKW